MITLTSGATSAVIDTTAGTAGVIASSGDFGGDNVRVNLSYALTGAPTVFAPIEGGSFGSHFARAIAFPGSKLKAELVNATGSTALNIETAAS